MHYSTPRNADVTLPNEKLPKSTYFQRSRAQYSSASSQTIIRVKKYAKGDGATDDTEAFQQAINDAAANGSLILIESGSYLLSDTITIPAGAQIVGEAWPELIAIGAKFQDSSNPRPLVRVGEPGSIGGVELQDLIFTSKESAAGLVGVEWNIKADRAGSAAIWGMFESPLKHLSRLT